MIGGVLVLVFSRVFKASYYSGLGVVIAFFLTVYYNDFSFEVFAAIALMLIVICEIYLGKDKWKVAIGALIGAVSTAISYFLVEWIFS